MERTLTPEEAEDVVAVCIEEYGLSTLPPVQVASTEHGQWQISWQDFHRVEPPMTRRQWRAWVERHVGTLDPTRLETPRADRCKATASTRLTKRRRRSSCDRARDTSHPPALARAG